MVIFEFVEEAIIGTEEGSKVIKDATICNISNLGHAYLQHALAGATNLFFRKGKIYFISNENTPYNLIGEGSPKRIFDTIKEHWMDPE